MQPVGEECHRSRKDTGGDLDYHHDHRDHDDEEGSSLTALHAVLTEGVVVLPSAERGRHQKSLEKNELRDDGARR